MNYVILIGNLTRDPDITYKPGKDPICVARFTIAVDDGYGDKKRTDFINCVAFKKLGENVEKYLHKGHKAAIHGKIQTGSYEKDGQKVYTTEVIAQTIEF